MLVKIIYYICGQTKPQFVSMNHFQEEIELGISGVRKLVESVMTSQGFDLGCYSMTSLKRRVVNFMQKEDMSNLDNLISRLTTDKGYFQYFLSQITVEVTEFFRDPALWRYFRDEIIPVLYRTNSEVNYWLPGCSSADEVYTLAIVLSEAGVYNRSRIIASDINTHIIEKAKLARFPNSKLEISEANFKRYNEKGDFSQYIIQEKSGFTIAPGLLKQISFEVFNYQQEEKIKGIHLIVCRNNFIYFSSQFQDKILSIFHQSLSLNGLLIIGSKESIDNCKDFGKFAVMNESEKVYKKTGA